MRKEILHRHPSERVMKVQELISLVGDASSPETSKYLAQVEQAYPDGKFIAKLSYWGDGSISSVFVQTHFESVKIGNTEYKIKNGKVLYPGTEKIFPTLEAYTGITFFL